MSEITHSGELSQKNNINDLDGSVLTILIKLIIEGIELNDIKYKSFYIVINVISQYKLKRKTYIVI
jgi:hypothetical protein